MEATADIALMGMLLDADRAVFLFLNGMHNHFWDVVMYWMSDSKLWIPLYAYFLWLLHLQFGRRIWIILLMAAMLITLTDQSSVHLFKDQFLRLRPCHDPLLQGMVHTVNGKCGGMYGFISSHACNHFALATFLFGFYRSAWPRLALLVLVWAFVVSYSRIYLGVHYPGDIVAGGLFGALLGWRARIMTLNLIYRPQHQ